MWRLRRGWARWRVPKAYYSSVVPACPPPQLALLSRLDAHNRLFQLLSFNPISIDPQLYIQCFEQARDSDDKTRRLLYQRLLFHQRYADCWQVFFDHYTDLTDVDDFVEMAFTYLKNQDNHAYGWFYFVMAAQDGFPERFLEVVMDTAMSYSKEADAFRQAQVVHQNLGHVSLMMDLLRWKDHSLSNSAHRWVVLVYLRNLLNMAPPQFNVGQVISEYPHITHYPGWLSHLSLENHLIDGYDFDANVQMNTNDILKAMPIVDPGTLWKVYRRVDQPDKLIVSQLVQKMVNTEGNPVDIEHLIESNELTLDTLDADHISKLLTKVTLDKLAKQLVAKTSLMADGEAKICQFITLSPLLTQKLGIAILGDILKLSIHHDNVFEAIDARDNAPAIYRGLVHLDDLKPSVLLAALRHGLDHHGLVEEHFLVPIFEKYLKLQFDPVEIYKKPYRLTVIATNEVDFQKHWLYALPQDRAAFKRALSKLGGALSVLCPQPRLFCQAMEVLFAYVYLDRFGWLSEMQFGKRYVYQNLCHHIGLRVEQMSRGLYIMRDILAEYKLPSRVFAGATLRMMSQRNVKALVALAADSTIPLYHIQEILMGLITLPQLSVPERLKWVEAVVAKVEARHPGFKMHTRVVYRLVSEIKRYQQQQGFNGASKLDLAWLSQATPAKRALGRTLKLMQRQDKL